MFQRGLTALHYAAMSGHHGIVLDLIKMQANVDAVNIVCVNIQNHNCVGFHVHGGQLNEPNFVLPSKTMEAFQLCIALTLKLQWVC